MSDTLALHCPSCAAYLGSVASESAFACGCGHAFARAGALHDLRLDRERARAPEPVDAAALDASLAELERGTPYKAALEALLLALDDAGAERLMLLLREGRGSWHVLGRAGGGRALVIGNALSGTAVPLGSAGFDVVALDLAPARARLGAFRDDALAPGRARALVGGDGPRLPFADGAFDLVVQEGGLPGAADGFAHPLEECARVCAGELVLVADNRFGYKRSAGRRGQFRVPGPVEYARAALAPPRGERSLGGYRRALARPGFQRARAFALYPDAREFSHVVALDRPLPRLTVGPQERRNLLKVAAQGAGLFRHLTPSFALLAARERLAATTRAERALAALAETLGEPLPEVETLIATRGNTAVLLTGVDGRGEDDPRGRWCVHVPLSPQQREQIDRHHARLGELRARFPSVPAPEPLFLGAIEGLYLACERRLGGLTAPQLTGDHAVAAQMFADCARHLAALAVEPARPLDARGFEELVGAKLDLVARFCGVPATVARLRALRGELAAEMTGLAFPRVLYHADLRSKHVQVDGRGRVLGFLDWGSSVASDLPYFDLLHLIVHERKQEAGLTAEAAWRIAMDGERLREYEREALAGYASRLDLDPRYCRAIERLYPVLVGAMAESNWDYSRPRWVHRQFGV